MPNYAVGDIQGCFDELEEGLELINFNSKKDFLWITGDLINRGPDSLRVLKYILSIKEAVHIVLGNHDLHLLNCFFNKKKLRKEDTSSALDSTAPNDTVQHEAAYKAKVAALVRTANSDVALLDSIAHLDMAIGKKIPLLIYRTALKLGSSSIYGDSKEFYRACHTLLGRQPKTAELRALARLSYLLSQRNSRWGNHNNMAVAKEEE